MLQPFYELYKKFADSKDKFSERGLDGNFFMDVYRSQPFEPELYEYFSLPAIFVDYTMQGQGTNKPKLINLTLHIVTDELPNADNFSEQQAEGLKRFLYQLTTQELLEGYRLGKTTALRFMSELIIDEAVVNYHTQTYEFEAYTGDMIGDFKRILGEFKKLNIFGNLTLKQY